MKSRRRFVILAATALATVGGGAALAATQDDKGKQVENAVLADAANRLDVSTDELRTALSEAQQAQLDEAVKNGDLTQEQADRIKGHMQESGRVLGFPGGPGGPGGHHGPGGPGGPAVFDAIAEEGRITQAQADGIKKDLPKILNRLAKGPRFHRGGPGGPPPGGFDGGPPMGPPPGFRG